MRWEAECLMCKGLEGGGRALFEVNISPFIRETEENQQKP